MINSHQPDWRHHNITPPPVNMKEICEAFELTYAAEADDPASASLASAPVAAEAVTDEMIQAGAKAAREYFERTGGNDPAVIYRAMLAAAPAAPQASAENDWRAAIRKFMGTAIPALAAIANVRTPDEIDALEAMPREPVIDQVRRLSQACEELSRQVRPERPKADNDAARCTCPSGDGSLRHPCPAHPQTNEGRA